MDEVEDTLVAEFRRLRVNLEKATEECRRLVALVAKSNRDEEAFQQWFLAQLSGIKEDVETAQRPRKRPPRARSGQSR